MRRMEQETEIHSKNKYQSLTKVYTMIYTKGDRR